MRVTGTCLVVGYCVQNACMSLTVEALAATSLGLHGAPLCYGSVMVTLWPMLQLPHQPGERLCYGCCASQERMNLSALSMAPRIFFQPLSSSLTYRTVQTV